MAAVLCCVLPIYYVSTVLLILPTVVVLERGRVIARCFQLFHARLGDALARLATMIGLSFALGFAQQVVIGIVGAPLGLLTTVGTHWPAFIAVGAIAVVLLGVSRVVLIPWQVTSYADMRARHEPFSTAYLTA